MSTIKYILKNIAVSMRKSSVIFALFIICCIVSVLVILFSHGVYQNYETMLTFEDEYWNFVTNIPDISFGKITDTSVDEEAHLTNYLGDGKSTLGEFRQVLELMDDKTKSSFTGFYVMYNMKDEYSFRSKGVVSDQEWMAPMLDSRLEYDESEHQYGLYSSYLENVSIAEGRYITQNEELTGANVICLPSDSDRNLIGQKINFLDKRYEVIGVHSEDDIYHYSVPFPTLPDDLTFSSVSLLTDKVITTDTYRKIKEAFTSVYGDNVNFPEFKTADTTEQTFYASIMLISIVLSVLSAINLAILFRYIMLTRRKRLAVFRLSGCTRIKARFMYLGEAAGISVLIFIVCSIVYHYVIIPRLTFAFPKIQDVYGIKTYLYLFVIFIAVLLLAINIIFSLQVEKQPVQMLKKAGDK